jgi:hypothetical protein
VRPLAAASPLAASGRTPWRFAFSAKKAERMTLKRIYHTLILTIIFASGCLFAGVSTSRPQQREVTPVGCFTNVRSDGEHADGYSVQLWLIQGKIIGMIDYHRGLLGDPPMGVLTDIAYNRDSGELSFKARLTVGLHYCRNHKGTPSKDLLAFTGVLKADSLEGDILIEEQSDSPPVVVDMRKKFVMRSDDNCSLDAFEYFEVWRWFYDPVFKTRGPKW